MIENTTNTRHPMRSPAATEGRGHGDLFSGSELRDLASRASSIDDRLAGGYVPVEAAGTADRIARRIDAWCAAATGGDDDLFDERLARDGIDLETVRPLLGDVALAPETPLPAWAETFAWAAAAMAKSSQSASKSGIVDPERPIPFEEIFLAVADAARERCRRSVGERGQLLSEAAEGALQRALVRRLSDICAPSLFDGFVLARMFGASSGFLADLPDPDATAKREHYDRYVAALREGGLRTLFLERPVLARLIGTITRLWIDATDRFVRRLKADHGMIGETFHGGGEIGPVVDLEWGLSDPHNGGQAVYRLTFDCGLRLGYKPKDLGIDVAWEGFVDWLALHDAPPSARAPRVVARTGYGWVEWLAPAACSDHAQARRHFRRAGAVLCLFHLLRGTDFHFENVLAVGDAPAPVDLETLLHPRSTQFAERGGLDNASAVASERLANSVLSTLYLPHWVALPDGRVAGIGGLNLYREDQARLAFRHINSDGMAYVKHAPPEPKTMSNVPTLDEVPLRAVEFAEELVGGFAAMYRFVMARREQLVAPGGPLREFDGRTNRAVLRPTYAYAAILRRSLRRQCLSDGVDWSVNFHFLSRLSPLNNKDDLLNRVQPSERRSLERMDIPFFAAKTDGGDLELSDGSRLEECYTEASFDCVRRQLGMLSEAGLAREIEFIGLTLKASDDRANPPSSRPWTVPAPSSTGGPDLLGDAVIAAASDIAATLERTAIRHRGGAAWIGASPLPDDRNELTEIGYSLYSGSPGVALFLAALHRVTESSSARDLAMAAWSPLREQLDGPESRGRLARTVGIGGGAGLGGIVYAMVRAANLLGDQALLADASRFADLISLDAIAADRHLDVMIGSAGTLLSLLALHRAQPDERILEKAIACGRRLLAEQVDCEAGGRAWTTVDAKPLTGFSHGAAGIAYALSRLYGEVGDDTLRAAAQAAIDYETAVYSPQEHNWPDLRGANGDEHKPGYPCQWCHGAAGIGLGRLGGLDSLTGPRIQSDIEAAIGATRGMPRVALDHLCCGNFGRLEFLFSAGERLDQVDLTDLSRARADELMARAREAGGFSWALGDDNLNPGFFTGLSGVGYTLLRFTHADVLPSVLLWD